MDEHPQRRTQFPSAMGEWAFGAGDQAVTFVSRVDDEYYLEHGLSFFRKTGKLSLTPGHRNPDGERYRTTDPSASILRCFQCHSTGPLLLSAGIRVAPSEAGVQCEACHGPGSDHSAIRNPRKLDASQVNEVCGSCHRKPPAKGSDTEWTNPWNVRHQPVYLSQSACFVKGNASCITCHEAHQAKPGREICGSCHAGSKAPAHKTVSVSNKTCASCHMPKVSPGGPELTFTNHWIGVYRAGAPLRPIR